MLGRRLRLDVLPNADELEAPPKLISKKSAIRSVHARADSQRIRERNSSSSGRVRSFPLRPTPTR
jgi:hypothetical protein